VCPHAPGRYSRKPWARGPHTRGQIADDPPASISGHKHRHGSTLHMEPAPHGASTSVLISKQHDVACEILSESETIIMYVHEVTCLGEGHWRLIENAQTSCAKQQR